MKIFSVFSNLVLFCLALSQGQILENFLLDDLKKCLLSLAKIAHGNMAVLHVVLKSKARPCGMCYVSMAGFVGLFLN